MSRKQVFKALIAVLILNVMVFAFVTGCDDKDGGGGMNCCQFLETCEGSIGQQNCADQGGDFVQNAQCFDDVGLCIAVATPTPTPTPSATPTPAPTPTPTPTASPTPTPTPTVSPTPTPTPTPTPAPTCGGIPTPARFDDLFFMTNLVAYECTSEAGDATLVVSSEDTPGGPFCMIALDTMIMEIPVMGTITAPITPDGSMCIFDDTEFVVTNLPIDPIPIVSGKATLSEDGQTLETTEIIVEFMGEQPISSIACSCDSVTPLMEEARIDAIQRIHSEKMEERGIE